MPHHVTIKHIGTYPHCEKVRSQFKWLPVVNCPASCSCQGLQDHPFKVKKTHDHHPIKRWLFHSLISRSLGGLRSPQETNMWDTLQILWGVGARSRYQNWHQCPQGSCLENAHEADSHVWACDSGSQAGCRAPQPNSRSPNTWVRYFLMAKVGRNKEGQVRTDLYNP